MNSPETSTRGRVLFADDDAVVRASLEQLLRLRGFDCESVGSGAAALARLRETEFDAMIADLDMPGNDDLELIEAVPQVAAGLPVLLLTGRPSVETAARSVRLAVAAYLMKPPDLAEIEAVLDRAIADYRSFRAMRLTRERLHDWERELDHIERVSRQAPANRPPGGPMGGYLRVSLRQVIRLLADLERATQALERQAGGSLEQLDHLAALRHTVEVLERTKQNFKSKDLADLRRQLEELLRKGDEPGAGPAV